MDLVIGSFEEEKRNHVFKWSFRVRSRPGPCFNCDQLIATEQQTWIAAYGNSVLGVDVVVEVWKLPEDQLPIKGFEEASELIRRYIVRQGFNNLSMINTGVTAPSGDARQRQQLLRLLKQFAPRFKQQRDFSVQLAKIQNDPAAQEIVAALE